MTAAPDRIADARDAVAKYEEKPRFRDLAPTAALTGRDVLLACALAAAVCALQALWAHPLPGPGLWEPLAEAAGLRPPAHVQPGLWRLLAGGLFHVCGAGTARTALAWAGHAALGGLAALVFLSLRELLAPVPGLEPRLLARYRALDRVAAGLAALAFACSDPVWRLGQTLGPDLFELALAGCAAWSLLRFLHGGKVWMGRVLWLLLGALAAEGPLGVVLAALAAGTCFWAQRHVAGNLSAPIFNPLVQDLSAWHATLLLLLGFLGTLGLDIADFAARHGLEASGLAPGEVPVAWLRGHLARLTGAATPLGWTLLAGCAGAPCAVAVGLAPRNRDGDVFTSYRAGLAFLALLAAGFLPLAQWPWCWWARLATPSPVSSPLLLAVAAGCSAVAFAHALAVLGTDVYCRNFRRIALMRDPELLQGADGRQLASMLTAASGWRRPLLVLVPAAVLACTVPGARQASERALLEAVDAFTAETLREMGTARWIFTDGAFDALLELRGLEAGKTVHGVSLMAPPGGRDAWRRAAAAADDEDRELLRGGGWDTVRAWAAEKPARAGDYAVQVGFEAWQRARLEPPRCGGVLGRPAGLDAAEAARGVAAARTLAARVLDLCGGALTDAGASPAVRDAFLFVPWRLGRMARLRAAAAERAGAAAEAAEELALAERLEAGNPSLQRVQAHNDWMRRQRGEGLTPREGLRLALARADFALARRYAQPILNADAADPQANFAMGMAYFVEQQYAAAERHLKRMLERAPEEAAAWNNLGAICLRTGRLEEAAAHVARARELAPDAQEVRTLERRIRDARMERR